MTKILKIYLWIRKVKKHIKKEYKEIYNVDHYGSYLIDIKHLVIVIIFKTDIEMEKTKNTLQNEIKNDLNKMFSAYLKRDIDLPFVRFISDEYVQREFKGNYWIAYH